MFSVYFETYGCQMNVNDTEIATAILQQNGYEKTDDILKVVILDISVWSWYVLYPVIFYAIYGRDCSFKVMLFAERCCLSDDVLHTRGCGTEDLDTNR